MTGPWIKQILALRGRKAQRFCQHESHLSMRKKQSHKSAGRQNARRQPPKSPQQRQRRTPKPAPQPTLKLPRDGVLVWGRHAAEAVLANPQRKLTAIYLTEDAAAWLATKPHHATLPEAQIMDRAALDQALTATNSGDEKIVHQGVVLVARPLTPPHLEDWLGSDLPPRPVVILLDQITDSRNIGAIMRSARAFGAAAMIATDRNCPDENAIMLRAASGAAEQIPLIRVTNLARAMETLQDNGFTLAAMTADGDAPITRLAGEDRLGIIMGAEGKGLRRLTLERSDCQISIDINPDAESLNVSTAAAIALFAAGRRY